MLSEEINKIVLLHGVKAATLHCKVKIKEIERSGYHTFEAEKYKIMLSELELKTVSK